MPHIKSSISRSLRSCAPLVEFKSLTAVGLSRNVTSAGITNNSRPYVPEEFPLPYAHRILQPNFQNHQDHEQYRQHQYQNHLDPFQTLIKNLTFSLTQNPPSPYRSPATSARSNLPTTPTLPYLLSLLRCYSPNGMHWSKYALANPQKQYTRNLVYEVPGVFNLLMLVWTPGRKSPVHDHARSDCLMKILKGSIIETRFATPQKPGSGPLVETSSVKYGAGKVSYMSDSLGLHSVSNPSPSEYAVSLHLYTPPNAAMHGCNIYDENSGDATHVTQCPYDSTGGVLTTE